MKVKFIDLGKQYENLRDEILQKFDTISLSGNYVLSKELEVFEEKFALIAANEPCLISFKVLDKVLASWRDLS